MREISEIIAAMLAAYGFWQLMMLFRTSLLFPARVRRRVNAAIYIDNDTSDLPEIAAYVKTLAREDKISRGRLIIVKKSDIIEDNVQDPHDFLIIRAEEIKNGQRIEDDDDQRNG